MKKKSLGLVGLMLALLLMAGCAASGEAPGKTESPGVLETEKRVKIPEKLSRNANGEPILTVYQTDEEEVRQMEIETYLLGVLAGEMKNDWPMEALKAQAILARTFVLKFCSEKESKYPGADISTDIEEAQAYDETGINERIEKAVQETRGIVLTHQGELPYAWFHAHSGGVTARAKEGLDYEKEEPGYTQSVPGMESDMAPDEAKKWEASFPAEEVMKAAKESGLAGIEELESVEIGQRGESGRAVTWRINGRDVSAPAMRIALGSTMLRSLLIDEMEYRDQTLIVRGRGYGHGVGMPQWGAYAMAEEGKKAADIVQYYFRDVKLEKLW
ncbi:MAG: SpoIID/LytB domain-containing protein [Clostridiales bacterium]|nr:SpoIID/LytB domain-containing protein [Clostridiales bacterium]